jgi:hypothetical protein
MERGAGVTTFFFPEMELTVEALDGHEGVLYGSLHGNPELVLLLVELEGDPFYDLWELPQDFQGNMPAGSGYLGLGDHPLNQNKKRLRTKMEEDLLLRDNFQRLLKPKLSDSF